MAVEGPPVPAEVKGVAPEVRALAEADGQGDLADGSSIKAGFKPPEGIGYRHDPREVYAEIDSKLGRGITIMVPSEGPFPDIPRDAQRRGHQATRDRILVKGDVTTILEPSEEILREMPEEYEGFRGFRSPTENYAQPVNERAAKPVYDEVLTRESLGLILSERYIHEDFDVRAEIPVADMERAQRLARVMRKAAVASRLMTQEEADRLITASRVLRYEDEEIMQGVESGNVELLDGARTQEVDFVMGALRILDQTRPVQPIPRRRGVKIKEQPIKRKEKMGESVYDQESTVSPIAAGPSA